MKVKFTIIGEPEGKGRPRFRNVGAYTKTYTPEKTVSYENLIKVEYQRQCGKAFFDKDVPLDMRVTAYYTIPKSVSKKKRALMLEHKIRPIKKPDSSNIVKAVEDALNKVLWPEDLLTWVLPKRKTSALSTATVAASAAPAPSKEGL